MDLARRSIESVSWQTAANLVSVIILFLRSILLARLVAVEIFGIYAGAAAIVSLAVIPAIFGLDRAFIHRSEFTEDEEKAASIHFSLVSISALIWTICMSIGIVLLSSGLFQTALLVLMAISSATLLCQTPILILERRVIHRRRALELVVSSILTTLVAVGLAYWGYPLWALLSTNIVSTLVLASMMYLWRPVWHPHFGWSHDAVRYFLKFGSRTWIASLLAEALNRIDDLWINFFLGAQPLGFYSRAYTFASYPRQILAAPVNAVTGGAYAELKADRERLSKAFFRLNALLIRVGFLVAGTMVLIAPEFIRIMLGEKWMPMLSTFRILLLFTLLDPIRISISDLFLAVGVPVQLIWARILQLCVLVGGLFTLGLYWGIDGVAVAVNLMIFVGITVMLYQARRYIAFSPIQLFAAPSFGLVLGLLLALASLNLPGVVGADWRTGLVKAVAFVTTYGIVLVASERQKIQRMVRTFLRLGRAQV